MNKSQIKFAKELIHSIERYPEYWVAERNSTDLRNARVGLLISGAHSGPLLVSASGLILLDTENDKCWYFKWAAKLKIAINTYIFGTFSPKDRTLWMMIRDLEDLRMLGKE